MTTTIRKTDNSLKSPNGESTTTACRPGGAAKLLAGTLALTMGALGAGLAATALPAYADVVTGNYSIVPPSSPSGPVSAVSATPATVGVGSPTGFEVSFTVPAALLGARASWISVTPSETFGSVSTSVDLIAPGCVQAGTSGAGGAGVSAPGAVTVELSTACNINAGSRVEVDFDADAPSATGHFYFTVTTSMDVAPAASN
ncbi:MAG TPA: hypothetical protein VEJ84_07835, partial [Acidimicrobiales bacterium]|nr:hypothetical protein [Acidimicrobiales bacterium]